MGEIRNKINLLTTLQVAVNKCVVCFINCLTNANLIGHIATCECVCVCVECVCLGV